MYERFTDRARKTMALANQEANRFNHDEIGTGHLLLGLIKEGGGVGANALKNLGVDLLKVRLEVEKITKPGPEAIIMGKLPQTPRIKRALEEAIEFAKEMNNNYVGTEHVLMGLLKVGDGIAVQVLTNLKVNIENLKQSIIDMLRPEKAIQQESLWNSELTNVAFPDKPTIDSVVSGIAIMLKIICKEYMIAPSQLISRLSTEIHKPKDKV